MKSKLNELRLDAGIARIEKQQWLCVLDKETGMMIDPMIGLEKFAELIVQECLKQITDRTVDESELLYEHEETTECVNEALMDAHHNIAIHFGFAEHFGVEE